MDFISIFQEGEFSVEELENQYTFVRIPYSELLKSKEWNKRNTVNKRNDPGSV